MFKLTTIAVVFWRTIFEICVQGCVVGHSSVFVASYQWGNAKGGMRNRTCHIRMRYCVTYSFVRLWCGACSWLSLHVFVLCCCSRILLSKVYITNVKSINMFSNECCVIVGSLMCVTELMPLCLLYPSNPMSIAHGLHLAVVIFTALRCDLLIAQPSLCFWSLKWQLECSTNDRQTHIKYFVLVRVWWNLKSKA